MKDILELSNKELERLIDRVIAGEGTSVEDDAVFSLAETNPRVSELFNSRVEDVEAIERGAQLFHDQVKEKAETKTRELTDKERHLLELLEGKGKKQTILRLHQNVTGTSADTRAYLQAKHWMGHKGSEIGHKKKVSKSALLRDLKQKRSNVPPSKKEHT